jgi:hypothetical protein
MRLTRRFRLGQRFNLELMAEAYNVFNHTNQRVTITDQGFDTSAADFIPMTQKVHGIIFPGYITVNPHYRVPTAAYAPRQVQLGAKLKW